MCTLTRSTVVTVLVLNLILNAEIASFSPPSTSIQAMNSFGQNSQVQLFIRCFVFTKVLAVTETLDTCTKIYLGPKWKPVSETNPVKKHLKFHQFHHVWVLLSSTYASVISTSSVEARNWKCPSTNSCCNGLLGHCLSHSFLPWNSRDARHLTVYLIFR